MTTFAVFDDDCKTLAPLTDLRASFDIRTGGLTSLERLSRHFARSGPDALICPGRLTGLTQERHACEVASPDAFDANGDTLLVNGRLVRPDLLGSPGETLERDQAYIEVLSPGDDEVVLLAARVMQEDVARVLRGDLSGLSLTDITAPCTLRRPWDVVRHLKQTVHYDAALLAADAAPFTLPEGSYQRGQHALAIAATADVWPGVVFDTSKGPISIGERVTIRPGVTVSGPAVIGDDSHLLEHAIVRPNVGTGPFVKLAGEVSSVVVQGFTNKAHDGFLGDSWLGEWVNLGAATTTSNLMNTYGEISAVARPGKGLELTGLQFFGSILGDHVKTAIDTRLMTGTVMHTGTMWAASRPVSGCIPHARWITDNGDNEYKPAKLLTVARAAMSRRSVVPSDLYETMLREIATRV